MTEQELRRTAVIIPPTGRAVLCVWAAVPGLFAAPFVFWQSVAAGAGFCLLWGFLVYCLWVRACSFAAVLGERTITVYSGVANDFPLESNCRSQTEMRPILIAGEGLPTIVLIENGNDVDA